MEVKNVMPIVATLCLLCMFELGCSLYPSREICEIRECVPYEIIHNEQEFEIRKYNATYWAETPTIVSKSYNDAFQKGYNLLLRYIQGYNIPKIKMNMTAPFLVDFEIGSSHYDVNFKIPKKVQFPASYASQNITKVGLPMFSHGAVRRVDGYLNNTIITSEINELEEHLKGTPWEVKVEYLTVSVADYNPPLSSINEVIIWFGTPW